MKIRRVISTILVVLPCVTLAPNARAQTASPGGGTQIAARLRPMAGVWDVRQRMWPGAGEAAMNLPAAVARRRIVNNLFLEEVMQARGGAKRDAFTRTAYFNYNPVTKQWEYFSIDTRAPQMMNERGNASETGVKTSELSLSGGRFVAATWGKRVNVAFTYRLTVGAIQGNRQIVRLFLTPLTGSNKAEFRAFEYVYTRRP